MGIELYQIGGLNRATRGGETRERESGRAFIILSFREGERWGLPGDRESKNIQSTRSGDKGKSGCARAEETVA
eukprot:scaffold67192_cov32-Tisochrysis_lutea.AAC.1